ncbi:hypothetical protein BZA05DRAFT_389079 [Tricharina praecox]|uniref:uncharacterized protein n=1 Tax=Tricharina praecox TaxID=43433 RepID=UPI00221EAB5F|nr:uncharacterized protein BZA05DRAFT_389079 [Tricharina praecox]KAI5856598.1 hypothetical protein BZA05DRAFT_389079 [Tricharina praecox]
MKFECRSKQLWKENSDSKDKENKESSKENVVNDQAASSAGIGFLLLSREDGDSEPLTLRPKVDEVCETVITDRCATPTDWVVDSGATSHCTGMDHNWIRYRAIAPGEHAVIFADEIKVSAAGIGDIRLLLPCGTNFEPRHTPQCTACFCLRQEQPHESLPDPDGWSQGGLQL